MLPLCSLVHIFFGLYLVYQLEKHAYYYGLQWKEEELHTKEEKHNRK